MVITTESTAIVSEISTLTSSIRSVFKISANYNQTSTIPSSPLSSEDSSITNTESSRGSSITLTNEASTVKKSSIISPTTSIEISTATTSLSSILRSKSSINVTQITTTSSLATLTTRHQLSQLDQPIIYPLQKQQSLHSLLNQQ